LRSHLYRGLWTAAAAPLGILLVWGVLHLRRERRQAEAQLHGAAEGARHLVDEYVRSHVGAIALLARAASLGDPRDTLRLTALLRSAHERYPGFLTMLATDATGRVVAYAAQRTAPPASLPESARNVADREYFREPREGRSPFVSAAFRGRGFGSDPIVAISAALRASGGRFAGVVEGSLDLGLLRRLEGAVPAGDSMRIVIADPRLQVVFGGSDGRYEPLASLAGSPLLGAAADPRRAVGVFTDTAGGDRRLLVAHARSGLGWHVFVTQPQGEARRESRQFFASLVAALAVAIGAGALLMRAEAIRVTRPLEHLVTVLRCSSVAGLLSRSALPEAPRAPLEVQALVSDFEAMQERLNHQLTGLVPICAGCKKVRDQMNRWQPVEAFVRERSEAEFTHTLCPECAAKYFPESS
jgi:hypothetical protein